MITPPKVVLLEGEPYLARDRLTAIKKSMYKETPTQNEWVVFDIPELKSGQKEFLSSGLNKVGAEIRYPTWDGEHKTVVLRGIFNDQHLLVFLYRMVTTIPDGVTLIIWDEHGVIISERTSKDQPSWKGLRKLCASNGKAFNFGEPLSMYGAGVNEAMEFVIAEAKKLGKTIGREDAHTLLLTVGADRGLLITELARLSLVAEGDIITGKAIKTTVMSLSVDYPSWHFDSAMNSGNRRAILAAAESLMNDDSKAGWDYCMILGQALQMARWHIIVAHAAANGMDMADELNKFSSGQYTTKKIIGMPSYSFRKDDDTKDCIGRAPNQYATSDIISFVRGLISKCSSAGEAYNAALNNFLCLYDAHVKTRTASKEEGKLVFENAIRAYCDMVPLEEIQSGGKNEW